MKISRRQKLMVSWNPKEGSKKELSGSVHMLVLGALTALFISSGLYLFSVNQSAVQGYHMKSLEKEINALKQENAELRITEADLRSLQRIEGSGQELNMQKLENIKYLEERGPVALK